MKIGPFDTSPTRTTASGERTTARAAGAGDAAAPSESSTQVALSPTAALLGGNDPSFDTAKVERIAQAIRDGSFRIDAGAIADKLIDNAQELLARPPKH